MNFLRLSKSDNGFGDTDRRVADGLRGASSRTEADRIARDHGHKDAEDAAAWLRERSR